MSLPIKSHLPLITTRIEFKFNPLPPPPQITTRRDFDDDEESVDEDSVQSIRGLIPKPGGEAGKTNSGGYNLEKALGWTKKRYDEFYDHIKTEVADKLDAKKCFTHQKVSELDKIIQSTARKFDIENTYVNNWPIREALKSRLKYTSDLEKKKEVRKAQAELKEAIKPFKGKSRAKDDA
ncbi:hypothetical protein GALMADRAFT_217705 [Galerina marginata CBS 339.88]|uniref:Uncharacterized protein n=1 Tax=Galerina marginata (strain CBS 339.88) TaxID=685588 RepID=A0A067SBB0_GALM3|nr:hypothetical protein GALMADRAFT_217705 [Galerina marginata CBS 339.88]